MDNLAAFRALSYIANCPPDRPARLSQLQRYLGRRRAVIADAIDAGLIGAAPHQGQRGAPATVLALTAEGWRAYYQAIADDHAAGMRGRKLPVVERPGES